MTDQRWMRKFKQQRELLKEFQRFNTFFIGRLDRGLANPQLATRVLILALIVLPEWA